MTAIAITPKDTGGHQHRDNRLMVGTQEFNGSTMFDLATYYDGVSIHACTNVDRQEAEAIIAALRAVFPEQAPAPQPKRLVLTWSLE